VIITSKGYRREFLMADLFTDAVTDDIEPWGFDPAYKGPGTAVMPSPDVSFTVLGTPQHQGSKKYVPVGGQTIGIDTNDKKLRPWRREALLAADEAHGAVTLPGGVFVRVRFYFTRPANHFGTGRNAGVLKPNAPIYKESKPDTDKLQRAIGDVLTQSGIIRDDTKIVHWDAAKMWSDHDRVEVSIWSL